MQSDQFRLTIRTDNAAFHDEYGSVLDDETARNKEIASLLRKAADLIETYGVSSDIESLKDQNGNRVGGFYHADH